MQAIRIEGLPEDPLAAAAQFHAEILPGLRAPGDDLLLVFAPADHAHRGWRLAAVQGLARSAVPRRVNGVTAASPAAIDSAIAFLAAAPGVTGQYLTLDDAGAGSVLSSPQ